MQFTGSGSIFDYSFEVIPLCDEMEKDRMIDERFDFYDPKNIAIK